jgi:glycosyltransferase involved in cell wall biosynthesis
MSSFEHERTASWPPELEEIRYHSQVATPAVLPRVARFGARILVCLGHTKLVPLGAAALARAAPQSVTVYMGDTNGVEWLRRSCARVGTYAKLLLKRGVFPRLFNHTLCLGWSNEIAAETMGLEKAEELPLYTSDFALLGRKGPLPHEWHDLAPPILMCPARLVRQKNIEALVSAWRSVVANTDRGSLVLVGEGPLRARIERLGRDVPRSRFLMTGAIPRDSMGSAFGWADGVVLASVEEPWGMVVPEALGLGLPVLATDRVGAALSLSALAPGAVHVTRSDVASLDV